VNVGAKTVVVAELSSDRRAFPQPYVAAPVLNNAASLKRVHARVGRRERIVDRQRLAADLIGPEMHRAAKAGRLASLSSRAVTVRSKRSSVDLNARRRDAVRPAVLKWIGRPHRWQLHGPGPPRC
jgi:hypothetical protein